MNQIHPETPSISSYTLVTWVLDGHRSSTSLTVASAEAKTSRASSILVLDLRTDTDEPLFDGLIQPGDLGDYVERGLQSLSGDDRAAYALPALLNHCSSLGPTVWVYPGYVILNDPHRIIEIVSNPPVAIAVGQLPGAIGVSDSRPEPPRWGVGAVGVNSSEVIAAWTLTAQSALVDVRVPSIADSVDSFLQTEAASTRGKVESESTVGSYTTLDKDQESGSVPMPAIVDATDLWTELLEKRAIDWSTTSLPVQHSEALVELASFLEDAAGSDGEIPAHSARTSLTRDIRRASDPLCHRWNRSNETQTLTDWLDERSAYGATRLEEIMAMCDPSLVAMAIGRRATTKRWDKEFGRRTAEPAEGSPPRRTSTARLAHGLKWRWNILRQEFSVGQNDEGGTPTYKATFGEKRYDTTATRSRWATAGQPLSLIGCVRSASGLGEATRSTLAALRTLDRQVSVLDTSTLYQSQLLTVPGLDDLPIGAFGDVNVLHMNPWELLSLSQSVLQKRLGGRLNIGMWYWEPTELPAHLQDAFDLVDEVWVPTSYLASVFSQYDRVPVRVVGIGIGHRSSMRQRDMELQRDRSMRFLTVFDAFSSDSRKNPQMVVDAFCHAFGPRYDDARLTIKIQNLDKYPERRDALYHRVSEIPAITIIEGHLDRTDLDTLMAETDVYVSLHSSEGLGLPILESMMLGTTAIATGFGGNTDFQTEQNSWLVDYEMTTLTETDGSYQAGTVWARPDLDHAISIMRHVAANPEDVRRRSSQAQIDALSYASLDSYASRLDQELRHLQ